MLATKPGDILGDMGACDQAPLLAPRRGLELQGCPNTFAVDEYIRPPSQVTKSFVIPTLIRGSCRHSPE